MIEHFTKGYVPIEEELPALYRRDRQSWKQIQEYFSPLNQEMRQLLLGLEDLDAWLSPAAVNMRPPGYAETQNGPSNSYTLFERRDQALNEVAKWLDLEFGPERLWQPPIQPQERKTYLHAKANFLRAAPRLMRTRHTPPGLLEWLCRSFRIDFLNPLQCPIMLEHFAFRAVAPPFALEKRAEDDSHDLIADRTSDLQKPSAWQVTLLLPPLDPFLTWQGWQDLMNWIERKTPAHVTFHVHMVSHHFWPTLLEDWLPSPTDLDALHRAVIENQILPDALGANGRGVRSYPKPKELGVARLLQRRKDDSEKEQDE